MILKQKLFTQRLSQWAGTLAIGAALLPGSAAALDKVVLAYPQAVGVANADIGFGKKLGIFAEEGIDIQLVGLEGSARTVPQVAQGAITGAFANPDYLISALAKGERLPVIYVYNWRPKSPYEIVVKEDSPIRSVADLKGKKLGVGALTWSNLPQTRAILQEAGVVWQKDVQILPIGTGPAAWRQVATGGVDAVNYPISENERLALSGVPIRRLPIPDEYQAMFGAGLLLNSSLVEKNPDLVKRLGRAIAKTTVACNANPEACITGAWVIDPTLKPAPDKEAEWVKTYAALQRSNYKTIFANNEREDLGLYPDSGWSAHIRTLFEAGQIERSDLPIAEHYTNRFVPDFNNFDKKAYEQRGRGAS